MQDGSIHADSNTILSALERPSINIYAELLLNLQQVTIFASLNSSSDGKTSLKLSPDLKNISLSHDGEITHLRLPAKVTAEAPLKLPTAPVKELSFRLPIAEHGHPAKLTDATAGNIVPWSADSLTPTTQISCRHCNSIILEQPSVKVWKDLPSENWAEMMDFWHCHKPENEGHDDIHKPEDNMDGSEKGYTAASRLLAKPGVGFVDLCHFLLAKEDCSEIEVCFWSFVSFAYCTHYPPFQFGRGTITWKGNKKEACPRSPSV